MVSATGQDVVGAEVVKIDMNFENGSDSFFDDDAVDNSYWVEEVGGPLVPERRQRDGPDNFKTALFDVSQGSESVQWGGLATLGLETENHAPFATS